MKKSILASLLLAGLLCFAAAPAQAQGEIETNPEYSQQSSSAKSGGGDAVFVQVLFGSGFLGFILWMALFGCFGFFLYLAIDCGILVRADKIMPAGLVANVENAMKEGDVVKALEFCKNEPTPMANILSAGFTHVEEGFDVIQEAISAAADLEIERIMQRLAWLSVAANIGTVQGMIAAFANLGAGGTPDQGALAVNISQALWTTAGGLITSIPAVLCFYFYRGKANRIILKMEATTMELIKDLRNVEVVAE